MGADRKVKCLDKMLDAKFRRKTHFKENKKSSKLDIEKCIAVGLPH